MDRHSTVNVGDMRDAMTAEQVEALVANKVLTWREIAMQLFVSHARLRSRCLDLMDDRQRQDMMLVAAVISAGGELVIKNEVLRRVDLDTKIMQYTPPHKDEIVYRATLEAGEPRD